MFRNKLFYLFLILLLGFVVRLYKFNAPIADWHAWRQADTSAVSRFFVKEGFDVLHPKFYDLSNVPSGVWENPQGYRFVEFPIYNIMQALPYKLFDILSIEEWGRVTTIFSTLLSSLLLYHLVRKRLNNTAGLFASFFYLFIPFNIFYGRTILPDSTTVTAFLASIFFFDKWIDREKKTDFILSLIFASISLLLKPFAVFFFLPMLYLSYEKYGKKIIQKKSLWMFAFFSALPLILWRLWMFQYPGGIPQSGWLFNGSEIRFKGAFFQWIFAQRISQLILGYWGLPLLIIGFLHKLSKKDYLFFLSFIISSLFYLVVVATGNVQHDYYQILIMPSIAIYLSLGANFLIENKSGVPRIVSIAVLLACVLFMLSFGWYNIRANYIINHPELVRGGKIIDELIPKDAKVVVPAAIGDTTALYLMDRQGWSSFSKPLPKLIQMGADYMAIFNPKKEDLNFEKDYKLIYSSSELVLFDLRQK